MRVPEEIILSDLAETIQLAMEGFSRFILPEHPELKTLNEFIARHDPKKQNDYYRLLIERIPQMSEQELEDTMNSLPPGFARSELRMELNSRHIQNP